MTEDLSPAPAEQSPIAEAPAIDGGESPTPPEPTEAPSRMDAITKAFEAVDGAEDADPAEPQDGERLRGPDGKFVAKDKAPEGEEAAKAPEDAPEVKESGALDAPERFSADAKGEAWEGTPQSVKGEINRAIRELETGIAKKDEQLAPLKPYFEMAEKHGVTVDGALGNYINMENALRQDLGKGMQLLAQNLGMTVEDMFAKAQGRESQSTDKDRVIVMLQQQVGELTQQMQGVQQGVQNTQQSQQVSQIEQEIQQWAADKPRFAELEADMTELIETGYATSLEDAYEKASLLKPEAPKAPVAPPAPAQTRQARSVTGAPGAGSNPAKGKPSSSRSEAIDTAFKSVGLS